MITDTDVDNAVATLQLRVEDVTWEPTGEYLMLSPILLPKETEGGIILPDMMYRKTCRGTVIKKGPQCSDDFICGETECFFPQNVDFEICVDEARKLNVYIVRQSDVIMRRNIST